MKINAENREEWMFDFHEGTLSESDKAEVLNFLHLHPEFNDEFAGWAQTHALKNEEIQVPADLLNGILQPTTVPFYLNKFFLGIVTGIALTSSILRVLHYQDSAEGKKEIRTNAPTSTLTVPKSNEATKPTLPLQEKEALIVSRPNTNQLTVQKNSETEKKVGTKIEKQDSVVQMPTLEVKKEPNIERETASPDSMPTLEQDKPITEVVKTEEGSMENKKKKRSLLPFSIKPQSKFKPANSNF